MLRDTLSSANKKCNAYNFLMSYIFTDEREAYFHYSPRKLSWEQHREFFAGRLKDLMESRRWNIGKLAEELDVSAKTVGQWLRPQDYGEKRFPKYEYLQRIADLFDVSIAWLVGEIDAAGCETQCVADYLGLDPDAVASIQTITAVQDDWTHSPEERWRELSALLICLEPETVAPLKTLIEAAWNVKPVDDPDEADTNRREADAKARQARFELYSNIDAVIRKRFAVPKDEAFMTPLAKKRLNKRLELIAQQEEKYDPTPLIEEFQQDVEAENKAFEQARTRIVKSLDESAQ